MPDPIFKRILLKVGGESMAGPQGFGIDPERATILARKISQVRDRKSVV